MALDVKPTRSELLKLKTKIKLAKNGHSLLKKKRDGLIMEFFEILKEAKRLREEMVEEYKRAVENLNLARMVESELYLKSLTLAIQKQPIVKVEQKNVMGIRVPKVSPKENMITSFPERGYGIVSGSSVIDDAVHGFEMVLEKAVKVSAIETSMKKILAEIEKTKRRVNSLEFALIPEMEQASRFISFRLEEIERDGISSMKHIKNKKAKG